MAETPIPPDIAKMSFEDALAELDTIVRGLEEGQGKLDEAIDSYQRGAQLKHQCEAKLAEAKAKIDKISFDSGGAIGAEPADLDRG